MQSSYNLLYIFDILVLASIFRIFSGKSFNSSIIMYGPDNPFVNSICPIFLSYS
ncbi:hypothetical protein c7_L499 [Megavirus courdo7]|uniref:Uncharacterized protein n=1 Tax=Megavirus courdo7 TaxID=1128135 RepID=H2EAY9_9VIRU|nr:hypothetical protein c7_L499 [Megavirus courdo7]